jgi:SMC interacting uncharacterized protein involved in chromosome segregation
MQEMALPSNKNLKAAVSRTNASYDQQIENLKSNLKQAYKSVSKARRKSHQTNAPMIVERSIEVSSQENMYTSTIPHEDWQKKSSIVDGTI